MTVGLIAGATAAGANSTVANRDSGVNNSSSKDNKRADNLSKLFEGAAFVVNQSSRRRGSQSNTESRVKNFHGDMKRSIPAFISMKRSFNTAATTSKAMSTEAAEKAQEMADSKHPPLTRFFNNFHHSFLEQLSSETPSNLEKSLGLQSKLGGGRAVHPGRPVYNGHYVRVRPTPLTNPKLVIYSIEMANDLGLTEADCESEAFVKYFSGDLDGATADHAGLIGDVEAWATPYALSIMGRRYTNNVSNVVICDRSCVFIYVIC